ncbi:PqiC family protein [Alloalcanivorax mobilis]|uniref:PqiC family protein n=1 Tax=Alloalcanivorax mobilis TaxID=2019569 RepID=UPI000C7951F5|nr:ABC-type transport auxiliary lipoprotein family protein [Alloalcanivorax mobilis]
MSNVHHPAALVVLLSLALGGCLSSPVPAEHQYLLPGAGQAAAPGSLPRVELRLASYLDQDGVMVQTGPVEVHAARQHRWADPLPEQLRRALAVHLAGQGLPASGRLVVEVVRFQGSGDGQAQVQGSWWYRDGTGHESGERFQVQRPLKQDGYQELVTQLDAAWADVARQIARRVAASNGSGS